MRDDAGQHPAAYAVRPGARGSVVRNGVECGRRGHRFRGVLDGQPPITRARESVRGGTSAGDRKAARVQGASAADHAQFAVGSCVCAAARAAAVFRGATGVVGCAARGGGVVGSADVEYLCEASILGSLAGHGNFHSDGCGARVGADRAFDSSGDQFVFVDPGA